MIEDPELPDRLRKLWGIEAPRTQGPRPALTVAAVVEAAIALADDQGLEAVSMARVAERLGFTTMALYRHVESKDELLELMLDAAAGQPPPLPDGGWRPRIRAWTQGLFTVFRSHPWVIQIPVTGIPSGPNHTAWAEAGLAALAGTGLTPGEQLALVTALSSFVRADVSLARELASGQPERPWTQVEREHGEHLRRVLDPARFPLMTALIEDGLFEPPVGSDDDGVIDLGSDFALEVLLDGIEARALRAGDAGQEPAPPAGAST